MHTSTNNAFSRVYLFVYVGSIICIYEVPNEGCLSFKLRNQRQVTISQFYRICFTHRSLLYVFLLCHGSRINVSPIINPTAILIVSNLRSNTLSEVKLNEHVQIRILSKSLLYCKIIVTLF